MSDLATVFVEAVTPYDGTAIHSLWAYRQYHVQGDSIVAFVGPCDIPRGNIVDLEDVLAGSRIYSPWMLHFIAEHFDGDLLLAVHRQRLLASIARDTLQARLGAEPALERRGDDLFIADRKLSISIATATPVSCKIHFGVNIRTEDVPVKAAGLQELGVDAEAWALQVMAAYADELKSIRLARSKVRAAE